ncbi:MAG TPA: inositol-3-phosphate synthase, partial [Anaerolineae bacterium]|nr:inositol-3-phosphate synthase [Anaerolineae bacterium]
MSGPLIAPSSYFMKTPPKQFRDNIARDMTEAFIRGEETK